MLFINEFLRDHSELIARPVKQGRKKGFQLVSGFRVFFQEWKLTSKSKGILSRLYKERGIK